MAARKPVPIVERVTVVARRAPAAPMAPAGNAGPASPARRDSPSTVFLKLNDGQVVNIPVSADVKARWEEQFVRPNPARPQRMRFATVMDLLKAAYEKGLTDGKPQS